MSLHTSHDAHGRDGGFLVGLLAGAAVGGGIALLFAPRQGADTRQGLAQGARAASRRLTETYATVADTARRNAQRWANQSGVASSGGWNARHDDGGTWPEDRGASPSEVVRAAVAEATYTPSQNASGSDAVGTTRPAPPTYGS